MEVRTRDSEDVKPYLQELEFVKIEVPFPKEFIEIKVLLDRIYDSKVRELRSRKLLFGSANKITLLNLQKKLAMQAVKKNYQALIGMSLTAQAIKISHATELLETQTLSGLKLYLEGLKKQADQKKSKGVQKIVASPEFQASLISVEQLLKNKIEHPKIEELKVLIESEFEQNKNCKVII